MLTLNQCIIKFIHTGPKLCPGVYYPRYHYNGRRLFYLYPLYISVLLHSTDLDVERFVWQLTFCSLWVQNSREFLNNIEHEHHHHCHHHYQHHYYQHCHHNHCHHHHHCDTVIITVSIPIVRTFAKSLLSFISSASDGWRQMRCKMQQVMIMFMMLMMIIMKIMTVIIIMIIIITTVIITLNLMVGRRCAARCNR